MSTNFLLIEPKGSLKYSSDPRKKSKKLVRKHLSCPIRQKALQDEEKFRLNILYQASPQNGLFADFRADEIYFAMQKFSEKNIEIDSLFKLQKKIPMVYPWNVEYHSLRFGVNRRFNCFPLMIVMATTEKHVVQAFRFAKRNNIELVPRGGSHSFSGYSLCDGMVLDQSRRNKIEVDTDKQLVHLEPGVLLGPLAYELARYNLVLPAGTCPNNCISGISLGGGIGYLARKWGVTSDSMKEVRILTASGEVLICNENQNEDLFWACRGGGGGNFGIVLSFTFQVYKLHMVYLMNLSYPFEKIKDVIRTYQKITPTHPDELAIDFKCMNNNQDPNRVKLEAQYIGESYEDLMDLMKPFLEIGPASVETKKISHIDAVREIGGSGRWLPFFQTKNHFLCNPLSEEALEVIEKYLNSSQSSIQNNIFLLEGMGGQMNRIPATQTAFPHRNGVFCWMLINAHWADQEDAQVNLDWINSFYAELEPKLGEECRNMIYVNGIDSKLPTPDCFRKYYGCNLDRLKQVKRKYDPENFFHFGQSIPLE